MTDKKVGILKILTLADILLIAGIIILGTVSLFFMRATGLGFFSRPAWQEFIRYMKTGLLPLKVKPVK